MRSNDQRLAQALVVFLHILSLARMGMNPETTDSKYVETILP
jgi:hypothetical protein